MSREIKFRVYSERFKENKMLPVTGMMCKEDGVWFQADDANGNRKRAFHVDSGKVMQFTGLKDKNGVEIYEGDIVGAKFQPHYIERVSWKGPPDAICQVYWDYNGFRLRAFGQEDSRFADFTDFERMEYADELMTDMNTQHSVVVGNIYENADLLEAN